MPKSGFGSSVGYWSPGQATHCLECDPGCRCSLASTHPSPPEDACPMGGYCNPPNTSTQLTMSSECQTCTIGYYCPEGSVNPTPCPAGTYNPNPGGAGIHECVECTEGWTCLHLGQLQQCSRSGLFILAFSIDKFKLSWLKYW